MGILDMLFGGGRAEPAERVDREVSVLDAMDLPGPDRYEVVGESHRQVNLERVAGGKGEFGVLRPDQAGVLVREPGNRADPMAVAVHLRDADGMRQAGYLSREDARTFAPLLDAIAPSSVMVKARLTGGWDRGRGDVGSIGVVLSVPDPSEIGVLWWLDRQTAPAERHDMLGVRLYFAGTPTVRMFGFPLTQRARHALAEHAGCQAGRMAKATQCCVIGERPHLDREYQKMVEYATPTMGESDYWRRVGLVPPLTVAG